MREALSDLIARMATPEHRCMNSDDSISWKAYLEAETLDDPSIADELAEYLRHESDKKLRRHAYFILGKLGQRVRGPDCASILLSHLGAENNKYVLAVLLESLAGVRKPADLDIAPVFRFLQDDRWLVRHAAIQALRHTDSPVAEDQLLHLLETTSDPYDMTYCHATLNEIGSAKAIPFLEKNLRSRKVDV